MSGLLVLAGTPIGNLGDMSSRLIDALVDADIVYAEDTRRARNLLQQAQAHPALKSYFVGNEGERSRDLQRDLQAGKRVVLITDAGMPGVGDPGYSAVAAARKAGAAITVVPGPSAVTAAVAVAGMGDRFVFESFLPRKGESRTERIQALQREERAVVIFCSPRRFLDDLSDLADVLGRRRSICVTRELTKLHEEVWWGDLGGALDYWSQHEARGEITIVLGPATDTAVNWESAEAAVSREIEAGSKPGEAVRRVAELMGVPKNELYRRVISGQ